MYKQAKIPRKVAEASFTLVETIIALGLMVIVILEVSIVLGRAVTFSAYERKVTQASWIAKALLSELEYKSQFFELKEVKYNVKDEPVPEALCPKDPNFNCDFRYNLNIEEWKLPLVDLVAKNLGQDVSSMGDMIREQIKLLLGDEVLKVAHLEVFWPEGARQERIELAYLMTAQYKLDQSIQLMKPIVEKKEEEESQGDKEKKKIQQTEQQ